MIDPATVATGISLTKTAAELGKKLNEFYSEIKDREIRKKLDEVIDQLRDLKQRAAELEDENRELKEKLRFRSDFYDFVNPFHYDREKDPKHEMPLCAKCLAQGTIGPMSKPYNSGSNIYRR